MNSKRDLTIVNTCRKCFHCTRQRTQQGEFRRCKCKNSPQSQTNEEEEIFSLSIESHSSQIENTSNLDTLSKIHLKNDEFKFTSNTNEHLAQKRLEHLLDLINRLNSKLNEFNLLQYEHFYTLRSDIDIRRETLIHKLSIIKTDDEKETDFSVENFKTFHDSIQKQSAQMIQQVMATEEAFRIHYEQIKATSLELNEEEERKSLENLGMNKFKLYMNVKVMTLNKYQQLVQIGQICY